tara:strand:+ start:293 stop:1282 length:990 start_codon:yes stop_codon:yes gene_type:complete
MPSKLAKHVRDKSQYFLVYTARWRTHGVDHRVRLRFAVYSSLELADRVPFDSMASKMLSWLLVCSETNPSSCARELDVYILRAPHLKTLPASGATSLSPVNVNSGYATACARTGEIVVYRAEEWFKVFVHESFHAYGLDTGAGSQGLRELSRVLFPVEASHALDEAYTETWARIINVLYCAQGAPGSEQSRAVEEMLAVEQMFAAVQASKVLSHQGTHYTCIRGKGASEACGYSENTNVLAYYVLGGALINDLDGFLRWCGIYAVGYLRFPPRPKAERAFGELLVRATNRAEFISALETGSGWPGRAGSGIKGYLAGSLRMSAMECNDE